MKAKNIKEFKNVKKCMRSFAGIIGGFDHDPNGYPFIGLLIIISPILFPFGLLGAFAADLATTSNDL